MRVRIIIIIFILFLKTNIYSQNGYITYYENINLAEHFIIQNKYFQSDSCYSIAFNSNPQKGYNQDYMIAAINSLKMNDSTLTNMYLLKFAKRGGNYKMLNHNFSSNIILENNAKDLLKYVLLKKNNKLRKELKESYKEYANNVNWKLVKKVRRISFSDQVIARGFFTNLLSDKKQTKIENKIDSKNAKKILHLCKKYGWLGFNLIGEYRENEKNHLEKIDMLLRHFSQNDLKLLEPYILSSIKNLDYYPSTWAGCLDYCEIKNPVYNQGTNFFEMKQTYGMLSYTRNDTITLMPFGKKEDLKIKRKELFLSSIEDYCIIRKIIAMPVEEFIIIEKKK